MVAVPLYLWRRPKAEAATSEGRKPAASSDGSSALSALAAPQGGAANGGSGSSQQQPKGVSLAEAKLIKCTKGGSGKTPVEQCDRQPFFEEALVKAIRDNVSCAPLLTSSGTVNFVLDVDHKAKKLKVWAGKSGSIKRKSRKEVLGCVKRALPTPDWSQIPHQHTKYQIAVMASYPPNGGTGGP
jgi:hypothetical protein